MADNVTLPGTGSVVGTDDVGGVQYQQVKLVDGTLDSSTPIGTTTNPLKVTGPDCVSVLSTTITVAGTTSAIDTTGYGALVWQISGVWNGNCFFEASNDNTTWDTILVFSRDNLSLQDIITGGGLYTIRPSGKYVRLNVTNITGSMSVNAIGREAEGIAAADLLSLAMDSNNNTPLYVQASGSVGRPLAQSDFDGTLTVGSVSRSWSGSASALGNIVVLPCGDMNSASFYLHGGTLTISWEVLTPQGTWISIPAVERNGGNGNIAFVTNAANSSNNQYQLPITGFNALRFRVSAFTSGTVNLTVKLSQAVIPFAAHPTTNVAVAPIASTNVIGDVGIQYRTNNTGAATISKFTAAATTNAASIKASAGRVIGWHLYNTTASAKYFRFFNKASAPTMGTDSPAFVVVIPANSQAFSQYDGGISFATGIAIACTGAVADLDTTVTAANDVLGAIFYA